jgi:hypothetical protein
MSKSLLAALSLAAALCFIAAASQIAAADAAAKPWRGIVLAVDQKFKYGGTYEMTLVGSNKLPVDLTWRKPIKPGSRVVITNLELDQHGSFSPFPSNAAKVTIVGKASRATVKLHPQLIDNEDLTYGMTENGSFKGITFPAASADWVLANEKKLVTVVLALGAAKPRQISPAPAAVTPPPAVSSKAQADLAAYVMEITSGSADRACAVSVRPSDLAKDKATCLQVWAQIAPQLKGASFQIGPIVYSGPDGRTLVVALTAAGQSLREVFQSEYGRYYPHSPIP